jgi:signal transduction histidine kinase
MFSEHPVDRSPLARHDRGQDVVIWVRDTGAGIPANEIPHVFDRYWHARRGNDVRGNGLGLAIASGIVHRHGGRIWVESAVGEGSTFFFTLPVSSVGGETSAERLVRPPPGAIV